MIKTSHTATDRRCYARAQACKRAARAFASCIPHVLPHMFLYKQGCITFVYCHTAVFLSRRQCPKLQWSYPKALWSGILFLADVKSKSPIDFLQNEHLVQQTLELSPTMKSGWCGVYLKWDRIPTYSNHFSRMRSEGFPFIVGGLGVGPLFAASWSARRFPVVFASFFASLIRCL
jgi:hypothetical protein